MVRQVYTLIIGKVQAYINDVQIYSKNVQAYNNNAQVQIANDVQLYFYDAQMSTDTTLAPIYISKIPVAQVYVIIYEY